MPAPDTLVLGCTHFPPLTAAIRSVVGPDVAIVDSAATTAVALASLLGLGKTRTLSGSSQVRFLVTDGVERFLRIGPGFLGQPIDPRDLERIDLAPST